MVTLRADPWRPEFGADVEMALEATDEAAPATVDPLVESDDWGGPRSPVPQPPIPVILIDGVRRVDLRVLADEGGHRAWGLMGSYAAGAVRCDAQATFDEPRVHRSVVLGGGIRCDPITVRVGEAKLTWEPSSTAGTTPLASLQALQNLMREAEGHLAADLASEGLVVADGPLHFPLGPEALVVGMAKRMVATYLDEERGALLPLLEPGQRTPLFALGRQTLDRYAWYQRLVPLRPPWHHLSGIVRCEVRMTVGLKAARETADIVAGLLPRLAGRPGLDPRAPQNLTPVGALETLLRHRLGHPTVIHRALQEVLTAEAVAL